MANYKNSNFYRITGKQSLPAASTKTGTIETVGTAVIGTGTSFLTEIPVGSWIVDLAQDEVRKVIDVQSDTAATISNAFTADLAAATALSAIHERDTNVVSISVSIKSALADGELDGLVFTNGTGLTFSKDSRDVKAKNDFIDPIIVDGTGTVIQAMILK